MTFQSSVELTILTGCRGALEMDEEEEVRNFVGRLCAGFRLARGCIPRQKMRSATSGTSTFLIMEQTRNSTINSEKLGELRKCYGILILHHFYI